MIDQLIGRLDGLEWANPAAAHEQVRLVIEQVAHERRAILEAIAQKMEGIDGRDILDGRISELRSWKLHRDPDARFTVAANQFLPLPTGSRHSTYAHQHKGRLVTLGLHGRYQQDFFKAPKPLEDYMQDESFGELERRPGPIMEPGQVNAMDLETVHALTGFEDDTLTLCVYGPIEQDRTIMFNLETGKARINFSNETKKARFATYIRGLLGNMEK